MSNVTTHLWQIQEAWDKAKAALYVSKECLIPIQCEEGKQVWLKGHNLKTHHLTAKLTPQCYSPFFIIKKLSPVTYHLTLPIFMKIHPIFHIDLLTQYHETEAHNLNYKQPAPDIIKGESEWEVKTVIKSWFHSQHYNL